MPEGFPRESTPAVVPGAQPKVCARLSRGGYVVGQSDDECRERWLLCEDHAKQLVPVTRKDALSASKALHTRRLNASVCQLPTRSGCRRQTRVAHAALLVLLGW